MAADSLQAELQNALADQFSIERELPRGGMSRVFVATEDALRRRIVIKVLAPELAATLSAERFKREIALAARLQHPHIVPLLSSGLAGSHLYYTMPFVAGESLRERINRERRGPKGRTHEIERLIGRSLRSVCDMTILGERQVQVDCDVLQADGGTRTASICGAWIALHDALTRHVTAGVLAAHPITDALAAISVGIIDGEARLDLPYIEDSAAEVDMNVVMCGDGRLVEVQGTAEGAPFSRAELDALVDLAAGGIETIVSLQREMISTPPTMRPLGR